MLNLRPLLLTKVMLGLILAGLAVVGRRSAYWPLVNWGMYSKKPIPFPAPTATAVRLRVLDSSGQSRLVAAHELWGIDRFPIALRSFNAAFEPEDSEARAAHRTFLVHLLDVMCPSSRTTQVQSVHLTWAVEPTAVPPLILGSPQAENILGTFDANEHRPHAKERR